MLRVTHAELWTLWESEPHLPEAAEAPTWAFTADQAQITAAPPVPHRGAAALTASRRWHGQRLARGDWQPLAATGLLRDFTALRREAAAFTGSTAPRGRRLCCALRLLCAFPTGRPRGGPATLKAGL